MNEETIVYPKNYYKYPTEYHLNKDLYGSYSLDPNSCKTVKQQINPFFPNDSPNTRGDLSKCRYEKVVLCGQKPYYGGDATTSFPDGLAYQDLPFYKPPVNSNGMLTLKRQIGRNNDYRCMLGF